MKKIFTFLAVIVIITLFVAYFTKPGAEECLTRMTADLKKDGYSVGFFISHNKADSGKILTPLTVKDRFLYREIFYNFKGEDRKIAIAAFSNFYKIRFN